MSVLLDEDELATLMTMLKFVPKAKRMSINRRTLIARLEKERALDIELSKPYLGEPLK